MTTNENATLLFDNGYGVSMQRSEGNYSGSATHEVALLHRTDTDDEHAVCFASIFPDGVWGWRNGEDVADIIKVVVNMKPNHGCDHQRKEG